MITSEHVNHPRTDASATVVLALGHRTAAFFSDLDTGYSNRTDALSYARWLRSVGHAPATYTIAEYDALRMLQAGNGPTACMHRATTYTGPGLAVRCDDCGRRWS